MTARDKTFVRKLDVPAEFDEIKTGLKTIAALKSMRPNDTQYGTITSRN